MEDLDDDSFPVRFFKAAAIISVKRGEMDGFEDGKKAYTLFMNLMVKGKSTEKIVKEMAAFGFTEDDCWEQINSFNKYAKPEAIAARQSSLELEKNSDKFVKVAFISGIVGGLLLNFLFGIINYFLSDGPEDLSIAGLVLGYVFALITLGFSIFIIRASSRQGFLFLTSNILTGLLWMALFPSLPGFYIAFGL